MGDAFDTLLGDDDSHTILERILVRDFYGAHTFVTVTVPAADEFRHIETCRNRGQILPHAGVLVVVHDADGAGHPAGEHSRIHVAYPAYLRIALASSLMVCIHDSEHGSRVCLIAGS